MPPHGRATTCATLLLANLLAVAVLAPLATGAHEPGTDARSLGGRTVPATDTLFHIEAEDFADKPFGKSVDDAGATGQRAWRLDTYGAIATPIHLPEAGIVTLHVRARGTHPPELMMPHLHPLVNDAQRGEWDIGGDWQTYRQTIPMQAGVHILSMDNFNNHRASVADRTIDIDWVEISVPTLDGVPSVPPGATVVVDAPDIHAAATGRAVTDPDARNATAWYMWGVGCFMHAMVLESRGEHALTIRLRGNEHAGVGSHVTVHLDGADLDDYDAGNSWGEHATGFVAAPGFHVLEICYDNDFGGPEKRNLWLDDITIRGPDTPAPTPAPPTPTPSPTSGPSPTPTPPPEPPPPSPAPSPTPGGRTNATPFPWPLALAGLAAAAILARRRA